MRTVVPPSVNWGTTQGTEAVIYQQPGSSRVSVTVQQVVGFNIVKQDIFMLRSLNRAGLGQYCGMGKVGLYFSFHTTQDLAVLSPLARSPALALGECYSSLAITAEMLTCILSIHQPMELPVVCAF